MKCKSLCYSDIVFLLKSYISKSVLYSKELKKRDDRIISLEKENRILKDKIKVLESSNIYSNK